MVAATSKAALQRGTTTEASDSPTAKLIPYVAIGFRQRRAPQEPAHQQGSPRKHVTIVTLVGVADECRQRSPKRHKSSPHL